MATAELARQQLLIGGEWVDAAAAVFGEWSQTPPALELAQRIESGICHVNDTTVRDEPQMPFGGVEASGLGRLGSRAALEEFTELRWITVQELPRHYPI
jgi:vanillin dehydrogenase